ncbi:facilitated trehalose transporter Tret1-2 homolog [Chrysoperla carnea]|uniref:facilitated trehalose transporter Tret1-2 homolog n=1 Tax=Chrysoperla carnea TaxID=189513 RepID=UPI001D0903E2|nr:facilitated trehalose transporter Tret1-2 homolog [Chrysoperla carnea]
MEMETDVRVKTATKCCTRRWLQYAATLAATLSMFSSGMHFVWASPSLPKLYANDSSIPITLDQGSWLASISLIAELPGSPLGAFSAEYFGRKNAILLTAIPYLTAWIMIILANNVTTLLVARFIVGIADGSTYTILPMYIGEIAEDDIRGKLGNSITMMMDFGAVFIYSVGPWVSIKAMAGIASVFPLILIVIFMWMPETPYYLLMKGKKVKAKKSLKAFRGFENVDEEFDEMSAIVDEQMSHKSKWSELFFVRSNFKALCILLGLKTVQQMSGVSAFLVYSEIIFQKAGGLISGEICAIIFGFVQFLSSLFCTLVVDLFGRRILLMISAGGCFFALVAQTAYFYIQYNINPQIEEEYGWVPLTCMLFYVIMYSLGLGAIPMMVPSELFPTNIKAKALCVMDLYLAMAAFVTTIFYQSLAVKFGDHIPFSIFAISCVIGITWIYFCVPETKGRSLEEIQEILKGTYQKQPPLNEKEMEPLKK